MLTKVGNGERSKELEGQDIQGQDTNAAIFLTAGYAHKVNVSLGEKGGKQTWTRLGHFDIVL